MWLCLELELRNTVEVKDFFITEDQQKCNNNDIIPFIMYPSESQIV